MINKVEIVGKYIFYFFTYRVGNVMDFHKDKNAKELEKVIWLV